MPMNWFAEQRQEWIAETLRVFGFINRAHITRKFRVSTPQASYDLAVYARNHQGAMYYDASAKRFVALTNPNEE